MKHTLLRIGMLCWLLLAAPALQAHHSVIEFDYTHAYAVTGKVKELQWTNPHSWVQVLVPDAAGKEVEFGFEMGAPVFNIRLGWRKDSVMPGDAVTVVYCPSKNGSPRGTLMYIKLPSGEVLSGVAPRIYSGPSVEDMSKVPPPPLLGKQ
ncbi:MAG TPA: DUF6152 family protein [Candidatus Acidoferrum sp.]|nr:DUF6152 family protein [Candidatus Acidoferrum sp.]